MYDFIEELEQCIDTVRNEAKKIDLRGRLTECLKVHWDYCGHLVRTKHQGEYYRFVLENLQPGEIVLVVDYKMKVELGVRTRENQRQWYGKRGISLHGCYIVAHTVNGEKVSGVLDLWSEDSKQDSWFTQSALDVILGWIEATYPGYTIYLFSGRFIYQYMYLHYKCIYYSTRMSFV